MGGPIAVLCPQVAEVDVVHSEVGVAKRCVRGNSKPCGTRPSQTGVQGRRDDQHAGVNVVHRLAGIVLVGSSPGDGDAVASGIGESAAIGLLAEQSDRARARQVELLMVGSCKHQNCVGGVVVGEGGKRSLDRLELSGGVRRVGHDDRALRAFQTRLACLPSSCRETRLESSRVHKQNVQKKQKTTIEKHRDCGCYPWIR